MFPTSNTTYKYTHPPIKPLTYSPNFPFPSHQYSLPLTFLSLTPNFTHSPQKFFSLSLSHTHALPLNNAHPHNLLLLSLPLPMHSYPHPTSLIPHSPYIPSATPCLPLSWFKPIHHSRLENSTFLSHLVAPYVFYLFDVFVTLCLSPCSSPLHLPHLTRFLLPLLHSLQLLSIMLSSSPLLSVLLPFRFFLYLRSPILLAPSHGFPSKQTSLQAHLPTSMPPRMHHLVAEGTSSLQTFWIKPSKRDTYHQSYYTICILRSGCHRWIVCRSVLKYSPYSPLV